MQRHHDDARACYWNLRAGVAYQRVLAQVAAVASVGEVLRLRRSQQQSDMHASTAAIDTANQNGHASSEARNYPESAAEILQSSTTKCSGWRRSCAYTEY